MGHIHILALGVALAGFTSHPARPLYNPLSAVQTAWDLKGVWVNEKGLHYHIAQDGDKVYVTGVASIGEGTIVGNRLIILWNPHGNDKGTSLYDLSGSHFNGANTDLNNHTGWTTLTRKK